MARTLLKIFILILLMWFLIVVENPGEEREIDHGKTYGQSKLDSFISKLPTSDDSLILSKDLKSFPDLRYSSDTVLKEELFDTFPNHKKEYTTYNIFLKRVFMDDLELRSDEGERDEYFYFTKDIKLNYLKFNLGKNASFYEYDGIDLDLFTKERFFYFRNFICNEKAIFTYYTNSLPIEFVNCYFKNIFYFFTEPISDSLKEILFFRCSINNLSFHNPSNYSWRSNSQVFYKDVIFSNCQMSKINLADCKFSNGSKFRFVNCCLPDTLDLSNISLSTTIDLTNSKLAPSKDFCYLNLFNYNTDNIKKIKLKYDKFRLYFPNDIDKDAISATYELLKKSMQDNGFDDSYQQLDCEFHQRMIRRGDKSYDSTKIFRATNWVTLHKFPKHLSALANRLRPGAILDTLDRNWWNYGYSKEKILFWSILFLLIFTIFNLRYFDVLLIAYPIDNLDYNKKIKAKAKTVLWYIEYFTLCLLFTGFLFFKLNVEFHKLNFSKARFAFYILFQYAIGLVCTGFLVNWILKG